jgi:hypothetical protein
MTARRIARGLALISVLVVSACVSTRLIPVDRDKLARLHGATIAVTTRPKPSFTAMTAGKAAFGMIGAFAMISAGNAIVREDDIQDPAVQIREDLSAGLVRDYGLVREGSSVKTDTGEVTALARQYRAADLVLDVQTINWSFGYFPTNWHRYRVMYGAKLRLIDTKRAALVAEGYCAWNSETGPAAAPTGAQLLAGHGLLLKAKLAAAAEHCIRVFRKKVLLVMN